MGLPQILPLGVRLDQELMAMNRYLTFFKAPGLEPHHPMTLCHNKDIHRGGSYLEVNLLAWFDLVWLICLKAYELLMGYLIPKLD